MTQTTDCFSCSTAGERALTFTYTNWRGDTAVRRVRAHTATFRFDATEWHPEPQWLMAAVDADNMEWRSFAVRDIVFASPQHPVGVREALEDAAYALKVCAMKATRKDDWPHTAPEIAEMASARAEAALADLAHSFIPDALRAELGTHDLRETALAHVRENCAPVAELRFTHNGYGCELKSHIMYALPEGVHQVYAASAIETLQSDNAKLRSHIEALEKSLGEAEERAAPASPFHSLRGKAVRPLKPRGEEAEQYRAERGPEWCKIFDTLRDYRMSNMADEDGDAGYPLIDLMSRDGAGVTIDDGEWEMVALADEISLALAHPPAQDAPVAASSAYEAVKNLPRRIEPISGQRFSYVKLDDVLALLENAQGLKVTPITRTNGEAT